MSDPGLTLFNLEAADRALEHVARSDCLNDVEDGPERLDEHRDGLRELRDDLKEEYPDAQL